MPFRMTKDEERQLARAKYLLGGFSQTAAGGLAVWAVLLCVGYLCAASRAGSTAIVLTVISLAVASVLWFRHWKARSDIGLMGLETYAGMMDLAERMNHFNARLPYIDRLPFGSHASLMQHKSVRRLLVTQEQIKNERAWVESDFEVVRRDGEAALRYENSDGA